MKRKKTTSTPPPRPDSGPYAVRLKKKNNHFIEGQLLRKETSVFFKS